MVSKKLRTFIVDGKEVIFDIAKFKGLFVERADRAKKNLGEYEYDLANELFVDGSAIHNWRMGLNGPGDLDKIHTIEKYWHLSENSLLTEAKQMENKRPLSDGERRILADIFEKLDSILFEFQMTELYEFDLDDVICGTPEEECAEYNGDPRKEWREFDHLMDEAYFLLRQDIYKQLIEFKELVYTATCGGFESIKTAFSLNFELEDLRGPHCIPVEEYVYYPVIYHFKEIVEPYLAL